MIELKNTKNKLDFFDGFNIINNTCYIVFYYYYSQRLNGLEFKYLPNDLESFQSKFPYEK